MSELQGLQRGLSELEAAGATVVAVTVDDAEKVTMVVDKLGLEFPVLSDPGGELMRSMGVFHAEYEIARPATFFIAENGAIIWRDLTANYRIRPRVSDLLEALAELRK